ncbi:hypothetical protein NT05LI_2984, partial [Listeria ivanovii FSL F6-596]
MYFKANMKTIIYTTINKLKNIPYLYEFAQKACNTLFKFLK